MRVTILLKPSLESTLEEMGLDVYDDYGDEVGFHQGYNIKEMTVQPGDEFTIGSDVEEGYLQFENEEYEIIDNDGFDDFYIDDNQIVFGQGTYIFHEDGITFEKL